MVSSPSNQPPRLIQPLLLRTRTHLTLATSSYHQVARPGSLGPPPTVVASMLLSFPLFAGQRAQGALQDTATGRRGCPEASYCIPLLTADSQLAEECNLLTNPTEPDMPECQGGSFFGFDLPAPAAGPASSASPANMPGVGVDTPSISMRGRPSWLQLCVMWPAELPILMACGLDKQARRTESSGLVLLVALLTGYAYVVSKPL